MALPAASVVPAAKVWRTEIEAETVQPAMLMGVPPTLTNSTNSPLTSEPGSLARISLRMTLAGLEPVMEKALSLVSEGVPFWASVARTRAVVVGEDATVQA